MPTQNEQSLGMDPQQFNIFQILIYRDGWKEIDKKDLKNMMMALDIYEDLFSGSITAKLALMDLTNLSDNFPLVGGERIDIQYNTPFQKEMLTLQFVVGSIANRVRNMDSSLYQGLVLNLVTPDRYKDINLDLSMSFTGPYSEIVKKILSKITEKTLVADASTYNQTFIAPYWSPLKCCKAISERSIGAKFEPFFFYETVSEYNFRSISTLYKQEPYAKLFIQPGKTGGLPPEKLIRKVLRYEDSESGNRIRQTIDYAFGSNSVILDTVNKRHTNQTQTYNELTKADNFIKIDKYPIVDNMDGNRSKHDFIMVRSDKSHQGHFYRNAVMETIDNFRYRLQVPGDSGYRVGQIIELDIPDTSVTKYRLEQLTSGRWLIGSLRHSISRDSYYTTLEILKDSHMFDIYEKTKGLPQYDKQRGITGANSPDAAGNTFDATPAT